MSHAILLDKILSATRKDGVSDLLLSSDLPPAVRIFGDLKYITDQKISSDDIRAILYLTMNEYQKSHYESNLEIDYAYDHSNGNRYRVNAFNTVKGSAAAFRKISSDIPTIDKVAVPDIILDLVNKDHGLLLVTGPTGSGKSTTLAAIIEYLNVNKSKHIITIEDPVEYMFESKKSIINQRQLESSTLSFPAALRSALREDPDVIMVGEMRDPETIRLALTAAETGHLVLSTLHTNTAYESINRIIDVFPSDSRKLAVSLLASSLLGVVSQRLVQTKDGNSRVPAHEVLVATNAVKNLIREEHVTQINSMMQVGSKYGMITLEDSLNSLVNRGLVKADTLTKYLKKSEEVNK